MRLEPIENRLSERVLRGVHDSGLTVLLAPKPGYSRSFGVLATRYGSIDRVFLDPDDGRTHEVPDGVAHFLEHEMFWDEAGDVSDRFAEFGADSNAFTDFSTTAYVFGATGHVGDCVDLLLDFVQKRHFTPDLVAKERGVIGQEIRMYDDDPGWRIYFNLLQALYPEHPVRINIAGSVDSIARIDPAVLGACHRAFYRPANMVLAVCGGFDLDEVAARVDADQRTRVGLGAARRDPPARDDGPVARRVATQAMDVARPKLLVGFRDRDVGGTGLELEKRELESQILLDLMFGHSAPAHERLYADGLIDDSFGFQYDAGRDFGFVTLGGDCDDPAKLDARLREEIAAFVRRGPAQEDVERQRRRWFGRVVASFDSVESVAQGLALGALRAVTPFQALDLLLAVTPADLRARAAALFDPGRSARSEIVPRGDAPDS